MENQINKMNSAIYNLERTIHEDRKYIENCEETIRDLRQVNYQQSQLINSVNKNG